MIDGGAGFDNVYFDHYDVNVVLDLGSSSIEWVQANSAHDTFNAETQTQAVTVFAGGGNDQITGSAYSDTLHGQAENDTLTGGAGDDALDGGAGPDEDTAVYSGNRADYSLIGTTTNFTITDGVADRDGADTVLNVELVTFADGTFSVVDLLGPPTAAAPHDFDGDGTDDILWRNIDGTVANWLMDGGQYSGVGFGYSIPTDWHVVGTGDFDGDGTDDILWRNDDDQLADGWRPVLGGRLRLPRSQLLDRSRVTARDPAHHQPAVCYKSPARPLRA